MRHLRSSHRMLRCAIMAQLHLSSQPCSQLAARPLFPAAGPKPPIALHGLRARLPHGPRRHRREAPRSALPLGPLCRLDQGQKPRRTRRDAGDRVVTNGPRKTYGLAYRSEGWRSRRATWPVCCSHEHPTAGKGSRCRACRPSELNSIEL
jgi:hypothetical protein